MTIFQKEKILQLRYQGASYSEIAKAVGLPRDTVKSFCRRNAANNSDVTITEPDLNGCRECGKALVQISGRKQRIFCSKECREKWWHTHPEKNSPHTAIAIESIVLTGVISVIGLEVMRMKRNEINYYISLSIVKSMLNQGVVSEQSYHEIVTNLIEKYRPVSAVLLSEKPLT